VSLRLDDKAVSDFSLNGYLLFREPVFDPADFDRLCSIFDDHMANKGESRADELDTPHFEDARLLEFLLSDRVLDIVEGIVGPNIGLYSSHFICKEPRIGRTTPWHEDSYYYRNQFSDFTKIVTVWLALDAVDRGNGCMQVIPGSHANGFSQYKRIVNADEYTFPAEIEDLDASTAVALELAPNEASLHDSRIIHGAEANHSTRRRAGYTMRYFSTEAKVSREGFPLWLARGRDLSGSSFVNT
jgi:ectoine hydroxylase-related dioxygenase (phytanoyl-CoA dioxygenase family)